MQYRHAPAANHADLDAVLVSAPGRPSLPVRLTLELFGRARAQLGDPGPVEVWDPCCGSGVLLSTLGLLRGGQVGGAGIAERVRHSGTVVQLVRGAVGRCVHDDSRIRARSTSNSHPGASGSKPCSSSQRAAVRLRSDHQARIAPRSTSVP